MYSTFLKLYLCHCIDKVNEGRGNRGKWGRWKRDREKGRKHAEKFPFIQYLSGFCDTIISLLRFFHDFKRMPAFLLVRSMNVTEKLLKQNRLFNLFGKSSSSWSKIYTRLSNEPESLNFDRKITVLEKIPKISNLSFEDHKCSGFVWQFEFCKEIERSVLKGIVNWKRIFFVRTIEPNPQRRVS